jgi:hypothetical protein
MKRWRRHLRSSEELQVRANTWVRPIEMTVFTATSVGGGVAAIVWTVIAAAIPAFVLAGQHPQYTDPNSYVWFFVLFAAVAGTLVGFIDALTFFLLRRLSDVMSLGPWAQFVAALLSSAGSVLATYWILLDGDPGTNPVLFGGILSAVSFAGFVAWILLIRRAGSAAVRLQARSGDTRS